MELAMEQKGPFLSSLFQNPVGRSIFLAFHFIPPFSLSCGFGFSKKKKKKKKRTKHSIFNRSRGSDEIFFPVKQDPETF